MSHSPAIPVQPNSAVQPNPADERYLPMLQPQAEIRPIDTLVNLLEKLHDNAEGIKMVLNIYCNCINDIVDPDHKTNLLMWAIAKKYIVCFNAILKTEINKEHIDLQGDNAVTYAAKYNKFDYAFILVMNKFNVNHANFRKDTVLSLTIKRGFNAGALVFINRGADITLLSENVVKFLDKALFAMANKQVDAQETKENKARRTVDLIDLLKLKSILIKK